MTSIILILAVIAAVFAIISGLWVAYALINAISSKRTWPDPQNNTDNNNNK
jgi:hypothetical protein